ncbi:hypothetical protein KUCAC02_017082 [Chaenocephalus aceratus]|nr:hypothetical protein KUCAC02_017082 [Chaenocephalus aceratus]
MHGEKRVLSPLVDMLLCFLPASSGVYHSCAHSIIPCTPVAVAANETSCQGRITKREHVEQQIRPERKSGASGRGIKEKGCRRG